MSTKKKSSTAITNEVTLEQDGTYVTRYGLPEVTVTGKKKPKKKYWVSPSNPKMLQLTAGEALEGIDGLTRPLLGWGMPSLYWGAIRDGRNPGEFMALMMSPKNTGFVTKLFEEEHPIASLAINLGGDVGILGAPFTINKAYRGMQGISKTVIPNIYRFADGPITPPTVRTAPKFDPFSIRQQRIQNKINAGIIPETLQSLIVRNGESEAQIELALVDAYKQMGISEQDARPWAKHLMKDMSEGVHTPVVSDDGKLIGGVSYVDRQRAIEMLRRQGITSPTESDIRTILGHEYGHLVDAPYGDKEFFTLMGQVLDNEGITSANPNLTVELILDYIDNYLALGRLDNGISTRKEEILDMPYKQALLLVKMINRYSGYVPPIALSAYIINKDNNNK